MAGTRSWLSVLVLCAATACSVNVDYGGSEFQCDPAGDCPSGFECVGGTCLPEGTPADDAGMDGSPIDASPGSLDAGAVDAGVALSCGSTAKLVDDFDDGVTGPQWGGGFADTGTEFLEQDGQLVFRVAAGAGDAWVGYYSRHVHDLTGHHVQIRVDQVGPLYTVLEVRRNDGAEAQLIEASGMVQAVLWGLASGNGVRAELPYDPIAHRWWRIRESDGVMHWELSGDGASWVSLHQEANPFPPQLLRVFLAAGGSVAADAEARMDELNPDGDATEPWCPIDGLRDDFEDGQIADEWGDSWADPGCALVETGGAAAIEFDGTPDTWCGYETLPVYDACSGQVSVEVSTPLDAATAEMWLDVYLPDGRLAIQQWEGMLRLVQQEGPDTTLSSSFTYDTTAHRWWRIRTDGSTTYWETSPDGAVWDTHISRPITLDCSTAYVGFGAGLWDTWSAGPITARFDDFNLGP